MQTEQSPEYEQQPDIEIQPGLDPSSSINETEEQCPKACTRDYTPVCGSDNVTYGNLCGLENAVCLSPDRNITLVGEGECPALNKCPTMCPQIYAPVCANNGVTYTNNCSFTAEQCRLSDSALQINYEGKCLEDIIDTTLPPDYGTLQSQCTDYDFECNDGSCISLGYQCNGQEECSQGEDELGCPDRFTCNDGKSIDIMQVCDKFAKLVQYMYLLGNFVKC